jgi:DNA polymerase IV
MTDSFLAYVGVPDLPIQVERRRHPELRESPVLVLGGLAGGRQLVEAVSDEARALGVSPGHSLRQASYLCPEAAALAADPVAYEAAFETLLDALGSCSPIVQPDRGSRELQRSSGPPEGRAGRWGAELDVSGLDLLFGPASALAAELVRRSSISSGLLARVGLGPNRFVARLAAGLAKAGEFVVVEPSRARAFLEPLSLHSVSDELLGEESRERLELLGVRSLGQLLRLPRTGLARQVGPDALVLAQAVEADGSTSSGLVPHRPNEWLVAESDPEGLLEVHEQFAQLVGSLAEDLAARLRERYLGAGVVRLRLGWASMVQDPTANERRPTSRIGLHWTWAERQAHLAAPTASVDLILEAASRLASDMKQSAEDARPPDSIELALGDLGPLVSSQSGLFEARSPRSAGGRRAEAARAVEELAERFRGRLQAPAFGASTALGLSEVKRQT